LYQGWYRFSCYVADVGNSQEDYEADKIRVIAYEMLDEQPIHVQAELLLKNFYQLVEVVPISSEVCPMAACLQSKLRM